MVKNHYRWDFIGLSTDTKPTPDTSEKVADGSTFYESDTSKYYVWCQDDWYEKTSTGGGGGGGGAVDTVNNVSPDSNGNVELTPSDIGAQAALTAGSNITIENETISATDTTYSDFVGATSETAGTAGLVPAPASGDTDKYLKSDGSWATVSQYSLPAATANTLGGVKIGSNLSMDGNDVLSATDTTYTAGTNVSISSGNVISATDTTYSNFVGTDGTAAGTAGLVPAPATTDAGKFLKADGTWDTAGSSVNVVQATGTSTTDVMSQNAVTNALASKEDIGTTETLTIADTDWSALSSSDPYDYSATVSVTATIGANSTVELINDAAVDFATYGFAIGAVDTANNTVTFYSIGAPSASKTLKVNVKG